MIGPTDLVVPLFAVYYRKAEPIDCYPMFLWRNDEDTVKTTKRQNKVAQKEHIDWFIKHMNEILIAEEFGEDDVSRTSNQVCAFRLSKTRELSWIVAPKHRGQQLGYTLISPQIRKTSLTWARIREDNIASQKIASSGGMEKIFTLNQIQYWIKL